MSVLFAFYEFLEKCFLEEDQAKGFPPVLNNTSGD